MSSRPINGGIEVPIQVDLSPVSAFVEVPIDAHHRYTSIELQTLETDDGRHGHAVIAHRRGGEVDVYFDPRLGLDDSWRRCDPAMAHLRAGVLQAVELEGCRLDVGPDRIDAHVRFTDAHGDVVEMTVAQDAGRGRGLRQFTPSPVRRDLPVLRLLLLENFSLVRRTGTVEVVVGGDACRPSVFRIPVGFRRRYSARFAGPVLLVGINPAGTRALAPTDPGAATVTPLGAGGRGLAALRIAPRPRQHFDVSFDPPLPEVAALRAGTTDRGTMTVDTPLGRVTTAQWQVVAVPGGVECRMTDVRQDWWPSPLRDPSLWLLAVLRRARRRDGLRWIGIVSDEEDRRVLESRWQHEQQGERNGG